MSTTMNSNSRMNYRIAPAAGGPITIQVGERRFITTKNTMTGESPFFAALMSGRWDSNKQADGSYFIDADPDLFEHILRYLRRSVLPIFYHPEKGHDHVLYLALLGEARYFQIARLENWLKNKTYLHAVRVQYSVEELDGFWSETLWTDENVVYHPRWDTEQVYICPREIDVHRGNKNACGRQCENVRGDSGYKYEDEPILKTLVIRKKTRYRSGGLSGGFGSRLIRLVFFRTGSTITMIGLLNVLIIIYLQRAELEGDSPTNDFWQ